MRIAVASHATIDHIVRGKGTDRDYYYDGIGGSGSREWDEIVTIGGPVCYAGLMVSRLHDLIPLTRVGLDFKAYADTLSRRYGMSIPLKAFCDLPTTRFRLVMMDGNDDRQRRSLYLLARCADVTLDMLDDHDLDSDACIVSPVIDEISMDTISVLAKRSNFTFLDPQGLLRRVDDVDGSVSLTRVDLNGLRVDAIKVDLDEAYALTGIHGLDSLHMLSRYSDAVVLSMDNRTFMYRRGKVYELATDILASRDSTGAGDIFAGAYTSAYVSSRDAVWALAYGVAAAYIALSSNRLGLDKVPNSSKDVEHHAYTLLERVKH